MRRKNSGVGLTRDSLEYQIVERLNFDDVT